MLVNRGTPVEGTKKVRILAGEREVIVCFVLRREGSEVSNYDERRKRQGPRATS